MRGDVYRVELNLLQSATAFTAGRISYEAFLRRAVERRDQLFFSEHETKVPKRLGYARNRKVTSIPSPGSLSTQYQARRMSKLSVTIIDVGWGDSILIESQLGNQAYYALVDSNDTTNARSSYSFLKRFFELKKKDITRPNFTFEFILLTHNHADHASGLSRIIRDFGARRFLYSDSNPHPLLAQITRYANRQNSRLLHAQAVDRTTDLRRVNFGAVALEVLWPDIGYVDSDENNNSVVLALTLNAVTFVLTGDATANVWPYINNRLPVSTRVFQVPHHGARNGTFDDAGKTPWLSHFRAHNGHVEAVMSSHIAPHKHPHDDVVAALLARPHPITHYRTDLHYHVRFETDGKDVNVKYSHV